MTNWEHEALRPEVNQSPTLKQRFSRSILPIIRINPRDMADLAMADIRSRIPSFRILIIGKANAGKTTILRKICETTDTPTVVNRNGETVSCIAGHTRQA